MRNALTFTFFVVLALGFWYAQSLSDTSLSAKETEAPVEITEKSIQVEIQVQGMPTGYKVRWFPPSVKVVCRLPIERYKDLKAADIEVVTRFEELQSNLSGIMQVKAKVPQWIEDLEVFPEQVEFLIEEP
ncbi:MAG: hypothetical protein LBU03_00840 [Tannerellaceae bacterium]|jgi:hypothetical protein|nr:hypothetical protein [Tannerellaceae bacterium]